MTERVFIRDLLRIVAAAVRAQSLRRVADAAIAASWVAVARAWNAPG